MRSEPSVSVRLPLLLETGRGAGSGGGGGAGGPDVGYGGGGGGGGHLLCAPAVAASTDEGEAGAVATNAEDVEGPECVGTLGSRANCNDDDAAGSEKQTRLGSAGDAGIGGGDGRCARNDACVGCKRAGCPGGWWVGGALVGGSPIGASTVAGNTTGTEESPGERGRFGVAHNVASRCGGGVFGSGKRSIIIRFLGALTVAANTAGAEGVGVDDASQS